MLAAARATLVLSLWLIATACGTGTVTPTQCAPGSYRACGCVNGSLGSQYCSATGEQLSACECGAEGATSSASPLAARAVAGSGAAQSAAASGGKAGGGARPAAGPSSAAVGGSGPAAKTTTATGPAAGSSTGDAAAAAGGSGAPAAEGGDPGASGEASAGSSAPDPSGSGGVAGAGTTSEPGSGTIPVGSDPVISEPVDAALALFDESVIHTFNIIVAAADLARIDQNPVAEQSVSCGLEFDGKSYGPYTVRYKGAGGSFKAPCTNGGNGPKTGKCSLKLDFNDLDASARFFGLKKLNLHSMNADPSLLRDRLDYRMYREMGVAAPRAMHARVQINGQSEGLYIAVEQIDGVFARARFREGGEGNVYKEIWPMHEAAATYAAALETNEKQPNVQHMLDFHAAIGQSKAAAERYFDRDYMMRYLAVDRVTINDDGVVRFLCVPGLTGNNPGGLGNHNYYWYEETQSGRMWLIPWDLDKSFFLTTDVLVYPRWTEPAACSCTGNQAYGSQMPTHCDPLFSHIQTSIADYEAAVDAFIAGPFAKAHVDQLIDAWASQIRSHVQATAGQNGALSFEEWEAGVAELKTKADDARRNRGYNY